MTSGHSRPKSWRARYLYGLLWWRSIDFVTAHLHIAGRMALALMLSQVATRLCFGKRKIDGKSMNNQRRFIFDRFLSMCKAVFYHTIQNQVIEEMNNSSSHTVVVLALDTWRMKHLMMHCVDIHIDDMTVLFLFVLYHASAPASFTSFKCIHQMMCFAMIDMIGMMNQVVFKR